MFVTLALFVILICEVVTDGHKIDPDARPPDKVHVCAVTHAAKMTVNDPTEDVRVPARFRFGPANPPSVKFKIVPTARVPTASRTLLIVTAETFPEIAVEPFSCTFASILKA